VLEIDHVILGVSDLDAATRRMEALGFGVVDRREAEGGEFGRALLTRIAGGDCLHCT
jgi:catechol 2,3-dioxygenase-like lactoylglutathione lyase family enzyme